MKTKALALFVALVLFMLTACSNNSPPSSTSTSTQSETTPPQPSSSVFSRAPSDEQSEQRESSKSPQQSETETTPMTAIGYDELVQRYTDDELAVIFPSDKTEINIHLVEKWASDYQQGTQSTLPVYWFGIANPSIMLIQSNGDSEYTINIYCRDGTSAHYTSDYVVERRYDYVFGADFPADIHPICMPKQLGGDTAYEWDGTTALGSMSLEAIEEKAKSIANNVTTFSRYNQGIRGSGIYLSESIMSVATPYESHGTYKIQEVREKEGDLFYVVAEYDNETQQISLEQIVLSVDGTNAFLSSAVDGSWIYCYDENERRIALNTD